MAKKKPKSKKRPIEQYDHSDKQRVNNPPVGLVTPKTDPDDDSKTTYQYDPHLDPQLVWTGKAERTSFEVPTVSLHVHERIDPQTIIEAVRARNGNRHDPQMPLFESPDENPPLRDALDFYKHPHNWTNRLIAGDSLLVMNSLLEKEGMAGKVQMVYIDPPYGIRYGSNFQPFVDKRDVSDGKDEDLTHEPEMLRAFRDTWELGIHSYCTYLRDRLLLARELLADSGACFVQIGQENVHHAREICHEIFGANAFVAQIPFVTTSGSTRQYLGATHDYLLFFAKNRELLKFRPLHKDKNIAEAVRGPYSWLELANGERRRMTAKERVSPEALPPDARIFRLDNLQSQSVGRQKGEGAACWFPVELDGKEFLPGSKSRWKTNEEGMARLRVANRLISTGTGLYYVRYIDDFPVYPITNLWDDTTTAGFASDKRYVVETNLKVAARCMLLCTDPGDLVFDPTCGSGTTAYIAEQWGRRWITCDTSRVAVTLAKQRVMTATYEYYVLAHKDEGVASGFVYRTVPHIMLRSIANNPELIEGLNRKEAQALVCKYADQETLYDQPKPDSSQVRVAGPFTVEAVPSISVRPLDDLETEPATDKSLARSGSTARQDEWRRELQSTGIRGRSGQQIEFSRIEPLGGTRFLHATGETKDGDARRVVVSFGPEHAPLEQRQVEQAWDEARTLNPKPDMLVFAAFQFDPEAAKDIDELTPEKTGMTFLKVQMNADLLTEDLKKKRASNESFWLIGQPDVELRQIARGEDKGKWTVEVHGFDYYNPRTGKVDSGETNKIAMWMLDTNYDGRSLYPRQVFFPMAGAKDGWARLAKSLKAEIDQERIEAYRGTKSLPFELGDYKRVAVKIVDDRGIESLRTVDTE